MFLALKAVGREAMRRSSRRKKKKNSLSAYEELRVYKKVYKAEYTYK